MGDQRLIISGCYTGDNGNDAWIIRSNTLTPELATEYHTNAEEADCRIWRHATQSQATSILIYSPDTDVYNIGLGLLSLSDKEYIIQLNVPHSAQKRYIHLNNLLTALKNDPDIASLPRVPSFD